MLFGLSSLAYAGTISTPLFWIAVVRGIIDANFSLRALDAGNATTCLRFAFSAFALILHRNTRRRRSAGVTIGFPITPANRAVFTRANGGLGLAHALRIGNFAFAGTEITVLLCVRACCARDATTSEWHAAVNRLALVGKFHV